MVRASPHVVPIRSLLLFVHALWAVKWSARGKCRPEGHINFGYRPVLWPLNVHDQQ